MDQSSPRAHVFAATFECEATEGIGMTNTNDGTAAWRLTPRYINGTPDVPMALRLVCDPTKGLAAHQVF